MRRDIILFKKERMIGLCVRTSAGRVQRQIYINNNIFKMHTISSVMYDSALLVIQFTTSSGFVGEFLGVLESSRCIRTVLYKSEYKCQ